jgi:hypothetical protein
VVKVSEPLFFSRALNATCFWQDDLTHCADLQQSRISQLKYQKYGSHKPTLLAFPGASRMVQVDC